MHPFVYVWDIEERICYLGLRSWAMRNPKFYTILGDALDNGPPCAFPHGRGTQADLERACRQNSWWNPAWSYPVLGEDPIPF